MSESLAGRRVLVIGASSGIGRAVAVLCAGLGAAVVVSARRKELLDEVAAETGDRCVAIRCDVRSPVECRSVVDTAADRLGGLDAVVYAPGLSLLSRFEDVDATAWQTLLETNVVGAALVARAALGHLEPNGRLVLLGSSAVGRPYPGLVPYAVTKAAVHELGRGLRDEHPWLRVTTVVVGPTVTGFAEGWDPQLADEMFTRWAAEGYPADVASTPEETAAQIVHVLASDAYVTEVAVMPVRSK